MTRAATETEHDEIRRRLETSTGATFELPAGQGPATRAADVPSAAGQRIRIQRPGEPEFVLREGAVFAASGIVVTARDLPDWAKNSIMTAAVAIRRAEYADAKVPVQNKES